MLGLGVDGWAQSGGCLTCWLCALGTPLSLSGTICKKRTRPPWLIKSKLGALLWAPDTKQAP